ncbi:DUF4249 domain-containing protein [Chitinophaga deserti]|uniref:DUF4249 domain-containing protein n=1 Tax=Chitinophaga deserti TaxID=2164099 RepID=UPI000D6BC8F9|nr:DUF4249 domain-containing protein [Chitinophaga deserti]
MKKIFPLITALALAACERPANIPMEYEGDRIVVNSLVQEDSVVYLRLTRSQPPGAISFPEIANAGVRLTAGNTVLPMQFKTIGGKGYYVSDAKVTAGMRYKVEVTATGLPAVEAADTLPRRPLLREPFAQEGGNRVKVYLSDLPGGDRYRIRLYKARKLDNGSFTPAERRQYRFDPSYNNSFTDLVTETYHEYSLIPDDRFDGKEILVVLQTRQVLVKNEVLLLEVSGLTSASWQYLKSLQLQEANRGNLLVDPTQVFTNVGKGYGIFAGISTAWVEIPVK